MGRDSRLCPRCVRVRGTVLVNRKDPKKKGKMWRIEVCPSCGFNFDLEEVKEKEQKLIEGPQPPTDTPPTPWMRWKPYY